MTNIMRKIYKIVLIILIAQIIFGIYNVSQAAGTWTDIFTQGDDFLKEGQDQVEQGSITVDGSGGAAVTIGLPSDIEIWDVMNSIYSIIFPLGVVTTVIVGGVLGIKFMMASVEDKAKIKESLIPYVVGCVVIYGAFGIWKLAIEIFSGIA